MEWRQQTSLSCTDAFIEAQHWIEEVTGKSFDCKDFRAALENGVLLCDLINQLKPGIIKRVNRLSTPIAGLDNVSVFLKACGKLGLNESQLFHPGDLQDLSTRVTLKRDEGNRRIKNVLITIYWLGRKAHQDLFYKGPQLNLKYFEGLLGLALSREKDPLRKRPGYKRYSSVDSVTSPDTKARTTFNSDGCGSDAEAEQVFKKDAPLTSPQSNKRYLPPPLQKVKRVQGERGCPSPLSRSKSLSDIPMVYPVHKVPDQTTVLDETLQPGPTHFKEKSSATKDTEAQWQDDFTKWKNRRRSSKCEVSRMSLEREHVINQMTNGANIQTTSQSGPIKRDQQSQHSPGSHRYSTSPSRSSKPHPRPHTRALLARSYATEMPYNTPSSYDSQSLIQGPPVGAMPSPDMNSLEKDNPVASLASVGTAPTTPTMEFPYSSQSHLKISPPLKKAMSQNVQDSFTSSVLPKEMSKLNAAAEGLSLVNHAEIVAVNDLAITASKCEASKGAGFDKYLSRSGTWSGSASLPRGYRRSEGSSRLSSAITARPFGTKPSRVSSLPRLCNVDDSQLNWRSGEDVSPPVTVLKRQTASVHLSGRPPLKHTELCAELEKENCASLSNVIQTNGLHPQPLVHTLPQPQLCTAQAPQLSSSTLTEHRGPVKQDHSDMRLCLTLRPNSRHDFGFQTHWDSRGARVTAIQPGSPAELCHLCINDEIIAVDGVEVKKLNFNQWKNKMSSALQTGNLTMDVRRYGNRDWSTSEASLYKHRTTLNLTSAVPLLIGRPDHHANTDHALMALSKFNGQANNGNLCQNKDGAQTLIPRTDTNEGGSESAISDLEVPSLSPSSCGWSWDRDEERRRQEKWQEEQERLLQEKYQRDQERLEAEWRKAQQDASNDHKDELKNDGFEAVSCSGSHQRVHVNGVISKTQDEATVRETVKDEEHSVSGAKETPQEKASQDWVKSLSTPVLTSPQKQMRGEGDQRKRKSQNTVSKAEQERQQILDEMKKRTQLLTDNSWIRQRSASFYKEAVMPGVPIKRYESMDHLESWRHTPVASLTFTFPRPQSAAAGFCGSTKISSSRHSTGSMQPPHRSRTEPSGRLCCVCEGALDTGAAMVIEALSLSFHLTCFQCMGCCRALRGTETGVQVRIQNGRPYCEPCFCQLQDAAQL